MNEEDLRLTAQEVAEAVRLSRRVLTPEEDAILVLQGMLGIRPAAIARHLGWCKAKVSRRWSSATSKFKR